MRTRFQLDARRKLLSGAQLRLLSGAFYPPTNLESRIMTIKSRRLPLAPSDSAASGGQSAATVECAAEPLNGASGEIRGSGEVAVPRCCLRLSCRLLAPIRQRAKMRA